MKITKIFEWQASHQLKLDYLSNCVNLHGHTYFIHVQVDGPVNKSGMVVDFSVLKKMVNEVSFDHKHLNDIPYFKNKNPTAENIVYYLYDSFDTSYLPKEVKISNIKVYETPTSYAEI